MSTGCEVVAAEGALPIILHSEKKGVVKAEKKETYDVVPMRDFVMNARRIMDRLKRRILAEPTNEPLAALVAAIRVIAKVYNAAGDETRKRLKIGLIKETKDYGNTSVSMGAAYRILAPNSAVGFLNCGTGGIKYQLYSNESGYIACKGEFKPRDACSPSSAPCGLYAPSGDAITVEENKRRLGVDLPQFIKMAGDANLYAFVTGTVREHWEKAGDAEKNMMEAEMTALFEPYGIKRLGSSYFMSQDIEGEYEFAGTRRLYANLGAVGLIGHCDVIGTLGIGRGSTQFATLAGVVGIAAGMKDLVKLHRMPADFETNFTEVSKKWGEFEQTIDMADGDAIIALKSGAALFIDNPINADIRDELIKQYVSEVEQQLAATSMELAATKAQLQDAADRLAIIAEALGR